jgi:gliding motility-associated-like protein
MKKTLFLLLFAISNATAFAQLLPNDDCSAPFVLGNLTNWCSGTAQFTNSGATDSGYGAPSGCGASWSNDVWYQFTAQAFDLTITINCAGISSPSMVLYQGVCGGTIQQVGQCQASSGSNSVDLYQGGLVPGATYFIRIASGSSGNFQLCINNYNQPSLPGSDCVTASLLCDKSPFTVQSVSGAGNDRDEAAGTCLGQGIGASSESNSTWFKWVCDVAGTLTFTLIPNNPKDDLDFVVFELPNGINNCSGKQKVRCEASGESRPGACLGPTGLSMNAQDTDEQPGCDLGQDNFVKYIDMQAGKTYALMINNFTSAGNGFAMTWGGSGTFQGPKADFTTSPLSVCVGNNFTVTDNASGGLGNITQELWSFGVGALPVTTATGAGPFSVSYATAGQHPIVHTVKSSLGCSVTKTIFVKIDTLAVTPTIIPPTCGGGQDGGATVSVTRGTAPYTYLWSNGSTTNAIANVPEGIYTVTISDAGGSCSRTASVRVRELELIAGQGVGHNPLCTTTATGSLVMTITNGLPPYSFDYGAGFVPNATLPNLVAGTYTVTARDANNCTTPFTFTLTDPPLFAITAFDSTNLRCFNDNSGRAAITVAGGTGAYNYVWTTAPPQTTATAIALAAAIYTVTAADANGCTAARSFALTQPAPIIIDKVYVHNSPCFGQNKGAIGITSVLGGTMPFQYSANCNAYQADSLLQNLLAGSYTVCVRDANNCTTSATAIIGEPLPKSVNAGNAVTIELGNSTHLEAVQSPFGNIGTFSWSPVQGLLCATCRQTDAAPTETTIYTVTFRDAAGCDYTDTVRVTVNKTRPVFVPNVFSPNGDGYNDVFHPFANGAVRQIKRLQIFDRWGELIYEATNLPINNDRYGWDGTFKGKLVTPATFVYRIELDFIDGAVQTYNGDVTVVY